jgi:hypothetical protein
MEEDFFDELELDPKELEAARRIAEYDIKHDDNETKPRHRKIIKKPYSFDSNLRDLGK